jgi:hypothetical protein
MKAVRKPDGTVEFDGSVDEISRAFGLVPPTQTTVVNGHEPRAKRVPPPPRALGTRVPGSVPAKIVALFMAEPSRVFSPNEVADMIKADRKNVRGTLSRMARDEDPPAIENVGRGKYRALPRGGAT